jgi:ribosomal protein S18 acetylase RimI-like enzyme
VSYRIEVATSDDIAGFLASAGALVATDAGRYDPDATDLDWAAKSGPAYAASLIADDDSLVLVARDGGGAVVGHLVGRLHGPGNVHPILVAELETIHVFPEHRGSGTGEQLVSGFFTWAAGKGAQRASVSVYAANESAQRFYTRNGFTPRTVTLDRDDLPPAS